MDYLQLPFHVFQTWVGKEFNEQNPVDDLWLSQCSVNNVIGHNMRVT